MSTLHGLVGEGKLNLRKGLDKYRGGGQEEKHNGFNSHTRNYIDCSDAYFL